MSTRRRRPILITLGVVVAVLVSLCIYEVLYWHGRFDVVNSAAEKIRKDIIEPLNGIPNGESSRGSTPLEFWKCMDVACPTVSRSWTVPIDAGKEADFIKMVFEKEGYPVESPLPSDCKQWEPGIHVSQLAARVILI